MIDVCGDNRFEIIREAKEALIASTNIVQSPKEMAVLNDFLFRCWQMGWLKKYEPQPTIQPQGIDKDRLIEELEEKVELYYSMLGDGKYEKFAEKLIEWFNQQPTSDVPDTSVGKCYNHTRSK